MKNVHSIAGKIALATGKGIIAGLAGTAAMSISQMIEMKINKRKPSSTPANAVEKVLHVAPADEAHKQQFVKQIHWTYGTIWGLARGLLDLASVKGWQATLMHYEAVWGTSLVMLPSIHVAPPLKEWSAKEIVKDGLYHLVYAASAGLVYDAIG